MNICSLGGLVCLLLFCLAVFLDNRTDRSYINPMNVGRPREFDSEQALEAAMHLFWRKGYEATSMQDLLQTMNLSKSSLYQTYGNKHSLFQQCLNHYQNVMTNMFEQCLEQAKSGKEFVEHIFSMLLDNTDKPENRIGCLVTNTASEFSQRDPVIAKLTKKATESFTQVFQTAIEHAQRDGLVDKQKDSRQLAAYVMCNFAGMNTLIKAGADKGTLQAISAEVLNSIN